MVSKKILIVSQSFYPENSPRSLRTTELVKEFSKSGHIVTLLTAKDNLIHGAFEKEYGVVIKNIGNVTWKPIIVKGKGVEFLIRRVLSRLTNLLFEYPGIQLFWLLKKSLKTEAGYDLMISVAVPHPIHWGVASLQNKNKRIAKVWVADCGDPYMGLQSDTFKKPFYFKYFERSFLKNADYISVPIKEAINAYYKNYHDKFRVIPQGFYFPALIYNKQTSKTLFIYCGNINSYLHYALPFFNFLKSIDLDFEFRIFTSDPEIFETGLLEIREKLNIKKYINRDELIQELANADFLLHFPYLNNTQRSLKLIDYWYAGKPIIHFNNTEEARRLFMEYLNLDFKNSEKNISIDAFRIENVCNQFLALCEGKV